jgi:hypothetical protein
MSTEHGINNLAEAFNDWVLQPLLGFIYLRVPLRHLWICGLIDDYVWEPYANTFLQLSDLEWYTFLFDWARR